MQEIIDKIEGLLNNEILDYDPSPELIADRLLEFFH